MELRSACSCCLTRPPPFGPAIYNKLSNCCLLPAILQSSTADMLVFWLIFLGCYNHGSAAHEGGGHSTTEEPMNF